jgi:hypothetical protein
VHGGVNCSARNALDVKLISMELELQEASSPRGGRMHNQKTIVSSVEKDYPVDSAEKNSNGRQKNGHEKDW